MKTNTDITQLKSFIASVSKEKRPIDRPVRLLKKLQDAKIVESFSKDKNIFYIGILRDDSDDAGVDVNSKGLTYVLGDLTETRQSYKDPVYASAAAIILDRFTLHEEINVYTSIVGLPPVFLYEDNKQIIITSDLYLLADMPVELKFNPTGITDLFYIGHPVDGRTLFENTKLLPGGCKVSISPSGTVIKKVWTLPEYQGLKSINDYLDLQVDTLLDAMKNMNLDRSFLSMTAGLDTRAVFSMLLQLGVKIPTCTMTGDNLSLDAITANNISNHYGYQHNLVKLNNTFIDDIVSCLEDASLYSGGLHSIDQAQEVFYYNQTIDLGSSRVSGNLGNQVCRKGVERITMRNANLQLINDNYRDNKVLGRDHWFTNGNESQNNIGYEFLLQKEVPYSSVANYCIGNRFAAQQTPYANRMLIENLMKVPQDNIHRDTTLTPRQMKVRDLMHRFFGHSKKTSFQIKVINNYGGYVANYPINWGWRASGGISIPGIFRGGMAFIDAAASSAGLDNNFVAHILRITKIKGLHEYTMSDVWMKNYLRDYVYDLFGSTKILSSGVFDNKNMRNCLINYYEKDYKNITDISIALDVALAYTNFIDN